MSFCFTNQSQWGIPECPTYDDSPLKKGSFLCLQNIRLGWKWLTVKNTLTYYGQALITAVKSLIIQCPVHKLLQLPNLILKSVLNNYVWSAHPLNTCSRERFNTVVLHVLTVAYRSPPSCCRERATFLYWCLICSVLFYHSLSSWHSHLSGITSCLLALTWYKKS